VRIDALVADAQLPNAVAGIRALGRAGVRAYALGSSRVAAGRWSRHAAGRSTGGLAAAVREHAPAVVYPGRETTIDEVLRLPSDSGAVLPWDPGSLPPLREKRGLPDLAEAHGLAAPVTMLESTAAELRDAGVALPAIVKAAGPVGTLRTAEAVRSRTDLARLAERLPPDEPLLVQEPVRGQLVSLALVVDRDGSVVERFQEEASRTWPSEAGSFAATVSVAPEEELVDRARSLLVAAGYWGLAQLDLVRTGDATVLLDVNPRFYACMPLALACGVNLPAAWHAVASGGRVPEAAPYPAGRRYRWLEGDVYAARHGDAGRLLRAGPRAEAGAVWAADDPLASALLAASALTLPLRRRLRPGVTA
jgi:predicted ATP-grasp superfamily ATP-dependent carboligase